VIDLAETKAHHVDEKAKMSIFEKTSLFAKSQTDDSPAKKIGAKRFIKKDRRQRSRTQPVTPEEVKQAVVFKEEESSASKTDSDDVTATSSSGTDAEGKKGEVMQEIEDQKIKDDVKELDPLSK
jgi:hypothetical protein